ncbi:MAG: YlcI/YnfO family protein [Microcoleaceae cyanobacterium]
MPNPFLGVRIPPDVHEALLARVQATGQSKSDVVVDALRAYLGMSSHQDRIGDLESRLSVLEGQLEHMNQQSLPTSHNRTTDIQTS